MNKRRSIIIVVRVPGVLIFISGIGGWMINSSAQLIFSDTNQFWIKYESKTRSFYEAFAEGCGRILAVYKDYTDYPLYIPTENNQAVPDVIRLEQPAQVTIWSQGHISITMVGLGEGMGFLMTWLKDRAGAPKWDLFMGGSVYEGYVVYSKRISF